MVAEMDLTDKKTLPSRMVGLVLSITALSVNSGTLSTMLRKVVEVDIISSNHLKLTDVSKSSHPFMDQSPAPGPSALLFCPLIPIVHAYY